MQKSGLKLTAEDRFNIHSNAQSTATRQEDNFISKNYLTLPLKTIASRLNRSDVFVRTRLEVLGLKVPPEIIAQRKIDSRLKPGNVPPNKGKKMTREQYKRCSKTMFKKGSLPGNTLFDGAVTIRKDQRGVPQKYIRLAKGNWDYLSRLTWKALIGDIPDSCVVAFVDGNTLNCELSNLMLLPKRANAERNRLTRYPKEVQEVIKLNNKLKRTINAKKQNRRSA